MPGVLGSSLFRNLFAGPRNEYVCLCEVIGICSFCQVQSREPMLCLSGDAVWTFHPSAFTRRRRMMPYLSLRLKPKEDCHDPGWDLP